MKKWTQEERDRAKILRLSGKSCSQIAEELGTTRSAVAGLMRRMEVKVLYKKTEVAVVERVTIAPDPQLVGPAEHSPRMLSILDLTDQTCRAPYDHEDGTAYCGHAVQGKTYCAYHRSRYFIERRLPIDTRPLYRRGGLR